jgi:hypothetical protein
MSTLHLCSSPLFKRALDRVTSLSGPKELAFRQMQEEASLISRVALHDPTPAKKYVKWMLTRLYRNSSSIQDSIELDGNGIGEIRSLLIEFEGVKHTLPVEQRDIFNYNSARELECILAQYRENRFTASKFIVNNFDIDDVMLRTQIYSINGLTVHKARCIEDVIVTTGADNVFDRNGQGTYRSLTGIGSIYIFNSAYGILIGACPEIEGEKGVLIDVFGEPAMFEDILNVTPALTWDNARDILTLMIKIDPMLPFDTDMTDPGPYVVALNQFPLVLHEDRELPESIQNKILASDLLSESAKEVFNELSVNG